MIKGKVKDNFIIFYINEFAKDVIDQLELLRQIANWYGRCAKINNVLFLKPSEDYIGHEKKLLPEIVATFQMLWLEYDNIISTKRVEANENNIKAGE